MAPEPALEALFGTSVGDVGALIVGTSKSTSSTAAPKPSSQPTELRPSSKSAPAEKITSIPPSSIAVTVSDLQNLVEQGVITDDVAKAVWEGFLRQHADRKTQASWGRQVLRRLRRGCAETLEEQHDVDEARLFLNEHRKVDNADERHAFAIDRKARKRNSAASKATSAESEKLDALFGTSVGQIGELLAGSLDATLSARAPRQSLEPSVSAHNFDHVLQAPRVEPTNINEKSSLTVKDKVDDVTDLESIAATPCPTEDALQVDKLDYRSSAAIDRKPSKPETAAGKAASADSTKLDALFSASVGEIGALLAMAPKQNSEPSVPPEQLEHLLEPSVAAKETDEPTATNEKASVVVIDEFDDLADFETIAATQGLTEDALLGDMTIVDACGNRYTWETFPPTAEFPIKMEFSTRDAKQRQNANDGNSRLLATNNDSQQPLTSVDNSGAAPRNRRKRSQRGNAGNGSKLQGSGAHSEPLQALFGSCVGEVGTLLAGTMDAPMTASIEHVTAPVSLAAMESEPDAKKATTKETCTLVINQFDDLNEIESIAAEQGLTESDLEGDLTIIDASGSLFTWETFSPATKFPIKMQITPKDAEVEFSAGYNANRKVREPCNKPGPKTAGAKSMAAPTRVATSKSSSRKQKRR